MGVLSCINDGHNSVPVDARPVRQCQVPDCSHHLRLGDLHRRLPLLPYFQQLCCGIRVWREERWWRWCSSADRGSLNDAYRYMDWLLTVPLLLIEIILVMKLTPEESSSKCWTLGVVSALMIISGCKGELIIEGNLDTRWQYWTMSMIPFLYIVYT